jgi:hypothetical protein
MRAESTIRRTVATVLVLSATFAPSALAQQDFGSPDARDAALQSVGGQQDFRSPDARDAALQSVQPEITQSPSALRDLRSPDARDAARDIVQVPQTPVVVAEPSSGFEWGDAGIGAGVLCGVLALLLGGFVLTRRRHGGIGTPAVG